MRKLALAITLLAGLAATARAEEPRAELRLEGRPHAGVPFNIAMVIAGFDESPKPDQPKLEITREGAVWYCPRSSAEPGVGVLYPDTSKMRTLAAYYHDIDSITSRKALRGKVVATSSEARQ